MNIDSRIEAIEKQAKAFAHWREKSGDDDGVAEPMLWLISQLRSARAVLKQVDASKPFVLDEAIEITVKHPSGGSGTMGPNMTRQFAEAMKAVEAALQGNQEGEK